MRILLLLGLLAASTALFAEQLPVPSLREMPALIEQLAKGNAEERLSAAKRITYRYCPDAVLPLINALEDEDLHVRIAAATAVAPYADPRAKKPLLALLAEENAEAKLAALQGLGELDDPALVTPILPLLKSADAKILRAALFALRNYDDEKKIKPYISLIETGDYQETRVIDYDYPAIGNLIFMGLMRCGKPALEALWARRAKAETHDILAEMLDQYGDPRVKIIWRDQLKTLTPSKKAELCLKLMRYDKEYAVNALLEMARSPDSTTRFQVTEVALDTDSKEVLNAVRKMLDDDDESVREWALKVISSLRDQADISKSIRTIPTFDAESSDNEIFANLYSDDSNINTILEIYRTLDNDTLKRMLMSQLYSGSCLSRYWRLKSISPDMLTYLMGIIDDKDVDAELRALAIFNIAEYRDTSFTPKLLALLRDKNTPVQEIAALALDYYYLDSTEAKTIASAILTENKFAEDVHVSYFDEDETTDVRYSMISLLRNTREIDKYYDPLLEDGNNQNILMMMLEQYNEHSLSLLLSANEDKNPETKQEKLRILSGWLWDEKNRPLLMNCLAKGLTDNDQEVRYCSSRSFRYAPFDERIMDIAIKAANGDDNETRRNTAGYIGKYIDKDERYFNTILDIAHTDQYFYVQKEAVLSLANSTNPRAIEELITLLTYDDPDAKKYEHSTEHYAAGALAELGEKASSAIGPIVWRIRAHRDRVRLRYFRTLSAMGEAGVSAILPFLKDADQNTVEAAMSSLVFSRDPRAMEACLAMAKSEQRWPRESGQSFLADMITIQRDKRAYEPLCDMQKNALKSDDRAQAAYAIDYLKSAKASTPLLNVLGKLMNEYNHMPCPNIDDPLILPEILDLAKNGSGEERIKATVALTLFDDDRAYAVTLPMLRGNNLNQRDAVIRLLAYNPGILAREALTGLLREESIYLRCQVLKSLIARKDPLTLDALREVEKSDQSVYNRNLAHRAILSIEGKQDPEDSPQFTWWNQWDQGL